MLKWATIVMMLLVTSTQGWALEQDPPQTDPPPVVDPVPVLPPLPPCPLTMTNPTWAVAPGTINTRWTIGFTIPAGRAVGPVFFTWYEDGGYVLTAMDYATGCVATISRQIPAAPATVPAQEVWPPLPPAPPVVVQ